MKKPFLAAVAVLATVLLSIIPSGMASAGSSGVTATLRLPSSGFDVQVGLGAVWLIRVDEFHSTLIERIDPATNRIRQIANLRFGGGGAALADGSLWVSDYAGNAVYRISPTGAVQARIPVGLQPQFLHAAFGSLWVSDHHSQKLSRIDLQSDRVVATVPAGSQGSFRDGPQDVTSDNHQVYVGSSNLATLQIVNPATNRTTTPGRTPSRDQFCGTLQYAGGQVWQSDLCSSTLYGWTTRGRLNTAISYGHGSPTDIAVSGGTMWVAADLVVDPNTGIGSHGVVQQRNPTDGHLSRTFALGGDVSIVEVGFGSLWVVDNVHPSLRRVNAGS